MSDPYRGIIDLDRIQNAYQSDGDLPKLKTSVYNWNVRHCRFRFDSPSLGNEANPAVAWATEGLVLLQRALVVGVEGGETLVQVEGVFISDTNSDVFSYAELKLPGQLVRDVHYLEALSWEGLDVPSADFADGILYSNGYQRPTPDIEYGTDPVPIFLSHWLDLDTGEDPSLIPFVDTRIDTNYDLLGTMTGTDGNYVVVRPYLKNGVTDGSYDQIYVPFWARDRVWYLGDTQESGWDWQSLRDILPLAWQNNIVSGLGTFAGYEFGPLLNPRGQSLDPLYQIDQNPGEPDDLMAKTDDGGILIRTGIDIRQPGGPDSILALFNLDLAEISAGGDSNKSEALSAFQLVYTYTSIPDGNRQNMSDTLNRLSKMNGLKSWQGVNNRATSLRNLAQLPPPTTEPVPVPPPPFPTPTPTPVPVPPGATLEDLLVIIKEKDIQITKWYTLSVKQKDQLKAQSREIEELKASISKGKTPGTPPPSTVSEEEERLMRIVKATNEEINILSRRISKLKDERVDPAIPTEEETRLRNQLRGKFELVRRNNAELARIRKHPVAGSGIFPDNFLFGRRDEFGEAVLEKYGVPVSRDGWTLTNTSPEFSMSFYEEESGLSYAVMTASDIPFQRVDLAGKSASFYRFGVTKSNDAWQKGVTIKGNSLRLSDFPLSGTLSVHLDRTATTSGYLISPGDIPKGGLLQLYTGVGNRGPIFSPPVTAAGISNVIGGTLQIILRKTPRDTVELIGVTFVLVAEKL